ncbi:MAG: tryptophan synthase subunit alpha [Phycisphaerae bacterium]|nr:tryptophan synthase subunit alpha [Phycisphaerae bacterium]
MGRIADIFAAARQERRGLVLPFLTGGWPDLAMMPALVAAMHRAGAPIVELGIPFSDPIADGPVIAASMHDALTDGVTPQAIFESVRRMRATDSATASLGVVAMVSVSIVHRIGITPLVDAITDAGLDGIIVPDVDIEVAPALAAACDRRDCSCSFLVAPTSTPARVEAIVRHCRGFVYLLARAGVTGATRDGDTGGVPELERQVRVIRSVSASIPIAAGFGIATPEHVRATVGQVDGAIVGSAIVRCIAEARAGNEDPVRAVERLVGQLVAATR